MITYIFITRLSKLNLSKAMSTNLNHSSEGRLPRIQNLQILYGFLLLFEVYSMAQWLSSFQGRDAKLDYFLAKKQHTQRKNCFPLSMWSFGQKAGQMIFYPPLGNLTTNIAIPSRSWVKCPRNHMFISLMSKTTHFVFRQNRAENIYIACALLYFCTTVVC